MHNNCKPSKTHPAHYQGNSRDIYRKYYSEVIPSGCWVFWKCDTNYCLNPSHMDYSLPKSYAYPDGVCTYCGANAGTKDHLLPSPYTGAGARKYVATVPACRECNSILGAVLLNTIQDRRKHVHRRLFQKYKKLFQVGLWTEEELSELDYILRDACIAAIRKRDWIMTRLEWPFDPNYDRRAMEKTQWF